MNRWTDVILLAVILIAHQAIAKTYPPMPDDAKKFLANLPGKTVSMDVVVGLAVKNSDSFQQIKALFPTKEVPELSSLAPLELTSDLNYTYFVNRNEPDSSFGATRAEGNQSQLGFSKYFSSGTGANLKLTHGHTIRELTIFGSNSIEDYRTSYAELSLYQNLWRDAFGSATRKQVKKGGLESEARQLEIEGILEDWLLAITEVYYRAWSAQADVRAAESGLARREKLLEITRRKISSGTAERPDLLQVKSAVVGSKIRLQSAREILDTIWRDLVVTLKLPAHWSTTDPLQIPVDLDNPTPASLQMCVRNISPAAAANTSIRRSELLKQAALLNFESAQSMAYPQLQLGLTLGSKGVDTLDADTTIDEVSEGSHPNYSAMLALKIPWSNFAAKAQLLQAYALKESTAAKHNDSFTRFGADWTNQCEMLTHWQEKVADLQQVVNDQKERVKLEEARFRLGRIPLINLIQAGDDQTDAEINLARAEVEFRLAAWRVKRLAGLLKSYLESIGKKNV